MSEVYHKEHLLDRAAMLALRGMIALQPKPDLTPAGRAAFDDLMGRTPPSDGVSYEAAEIGGVAGWWCRPPEASPGAAILYFHGGAYVVGSAQAYRHFVGQIAARASVAAFIPDYALAPERPFPAAVDDGEAAYRALAAAGVSRIAIVGDSAGGGLALVTARQMTAAARDGSVPRPVAVAVMSPWTDLTLTGDSMMTRAERDPLLTRSTLEQARTAYLGTTEPGDPCASPLQGDLAGLPPVLLLVGEDEVLLDDARRMADRIAAAKSVAELHVWQGMMHVFPANLALLRAAGEALDLIAAFLQAPLRGSDTASAHEERTHSMTRILFIGQKPETVDFSDPSLPPGFDAEKINAGIAVAIDKIHERGWDGDTCMITPDDAGRAMLEAKLASARYDCVVIGGGLRIPPKSLELFEMVVNAVHKAAPGATIAFNTRPEDTADASARTLHAR